MLALQPLMLDTLMPFPVLVMILSVVNVRRDGDYSINAFPASYQAINFQAGAAE